MYQISIHFNKKFWNNVEVWNVYRYFSVFFSVSRAIEWAKMISKCKKVFCLLLNDALILKRWIPVNCLLCIQLFVALIVSRFCTNNTSSWKFQLFIKYSMFIKYSTRITEFLSSLSVLNAWLFQISTFFQE